MSFNVAGSSTSVPSSDLPTVNEVIGWNAEKLNGFLKGRLNNIDSDIDTLTAQKVDGEAFLELTPEDLTKLGILLGPAKKILKLINDIQGEQPGATAGTSKSNTGLVSVFVDNSNLFIEGKYTVAFREKVGVFDQKRKSLYLNELLVDHGRLLSTVLNERKMGSNPIIVGSRPPPDDSMWDDARKEGYDVILFDRNIENKEKKVDTSLVAEAMAVITSKDPGILVLVAGDSDYYPLVKHALMRNWKVEIWFWSSGIYADLRSGGTFYSLDNYYRYFTCAFGPCHFMKTHVLRITDGEMIKKWGNGQVIECFVALRLFGWWNREGEDINMYFDNKSILDDARRWMETKYPDIIQII